MPSAHAKRSASGSKRWMKCTASIAASKGRHSSSSPAARLGTAAHALGEACLLDKSDAIEWVGGSVRLDQDEQAVCYRPPSVEHPEDGDHTVIVPIHATAEGLPPTGHEDFPIDANMADAVQLYLTAVRDEVERLGKQAELGVEQQFSLNALIGYDFDEEEDANSPQGYVSPNGMYRDAEGVIRNEDGSESLGPMFGTNDASVFLWMDHLTVIDYKHGQGIAVEVADIEMVEVSPGEWEQSVKGNPQEMYYALGKAYEVQWAFETIDLVIVQPRKPHTDGPIRRYSTTKAELRAFEEELRIKALETENEKTRVFMAGEWCTFCPKAGDCVAQTEEAFRVAEIEFDEITGEPQTYNLNNLTSDDRLTLAVQAIPVLQSFIKSTVAEQLRRLKETPGGMAAFGKLVRKKANRAWLSDLDIKKELLDLGFPLGDLYEEPKMKGPAKIEKLRPPELMARIKAGGTKAPAKALEAMVSALWHKPEGGITVAPANDPREAIDPMSAAASDFEEFGEEDA